MNYHKIRYNYGSLFKIRGVYEKNYIGVNIIF